MIKLIMLAIVSSSILNGVHNMELSRVSSFLAANPMTTQNKIDNNSVQDKISSPVVLKAPDKLFTGKYNTQVFATNIDFSSTDNKPFINSDSKVLHIGDSHTVGVYGKEIDSLMRTTGAKVTTVGSAGSSPSWWLSGKSTKSGFYSKDADGVVDSPKDWKAPHETPKLGELIQKYHPNIVIFSLGANLIHNNAEKIEAEVRSVMEIAKQNNTKVVWVGPPNGRSTVKPKEVQDFLYDHISKVVAEYGATFVDSRTYTTYPEDMKGDGVHFWGEEGAKIAKGWAGNVFNDIQNIKE